MTLVALILGALMAAPEPKPAGTILFVCEQAMLVKIERLLLELATPEQARRPL